MKTHKYLILAVVATLTVPFGTASAQTFTTLGVGISNPVGTLHVHTSSGTPNYLTTFHMTNGSTGTTLTDGLVISQSNTAVTIKQCENANFTLQNGTGKIIMSSDGKVGIGAVSSGSFLFNVNGKTRINGDTHIGNSLSVYGPFYIDNSLYCDNSGNLSVGASVSIGSGFYCDISGNLKVTHLKVTINDWPDYVFDDKHSLMSLSDVKKYIKSNGHLPDMPSAEEIEREGADLGEMNRLLVQKVEELTLYIIDLQQQIENLKTSK